jgi:hypothetical protein
LLASRGGRALRMAGALDFDEPNSSLDLLRAAEGFMNKRLTKHVLVNKKTFFTTRGYTRVRGGSRSIK